MSRTKNETPDGREKSQSNYLFGYYVEKKLFWLIFTLMLVFFTSPLSHLPYFLGYGVLPCIVAGMIALVLNVMIPLLIAHWKWIQMGMREVPKKEDHLK